MQSNEYVVVERHDDINIVATSYSNSLALVVTVMQRQISFNVTACELRPLISQIEQVLGVLNSELAAADKAEAQYLAAYWSIPEQKQ